MTDTLVPTSNDTGAYTEKVELDNQVYLLTFRFNGRMDKWVMDISDANSNLLVSGLPVLTEWGLIDRFKGRISGMPLGRLVALDGTGLHRDASELLLGQDVNLFYLGA